MFAPPRNDALCQCRTDSRQTCDFAHVSAIEVDSLTGEQGAGELGGAASGLAQTGAAGGSGGLELNVAGRRVGGGRENKPDTGAG